MNVTLKFTENAVSSAYTSTIRASGIRVRDVLSSGASFDLASRIQEKLMTIPTSNRGIHTANFRVLRLMSGLLVECDFE
jgi:hypothetical protein